MSRDRRGTPDKRPRKILEVVNDLFCANADGKV